MPNMLVWADVKAGGFFTGKGAESLEITSSSLQLNIFSNDILDIKSRPNFLFGILHALIIAPFTPVIEPGRQYILVVGQALLMVK